MAQILKDPNEISLGRIIIIYLSTMMFFIVATYLLFAFIFWDLFFEDWTYTGFIVMGIIDIFWTYCAIHQIFSAQRYKRKQRTIKMVRKELEDGETEVVK